MEYENELDLGKRKLKYDLEDGELKAIKKNNNLEESDNLTVKLKITEFDKLES